MAQYSMGLDCSTQSMTAVVIDIEAGSVVWEKSLTYTADSRLSGYGIDSESCIIPPRIPGEADQPPRMFLAALEAIFSDLSLEAGFPLSDIGVINVSGQQHGHVYLKKGAGRAFEALQREDGSLELPLTEQLSDIFSYLTAPIWKSSDTVSQADAIRRGVGGQERMIELSGSDSPLRFSGAVMRRVAERYPEVWEETETVQLISSFIPAVLTGDIRVGTDFGNGCGTSLMDYHSRQWSVELTDAAAEGLPGGGETFRGKLPPIVAPDDGVGSLAAWFCRKYGFSPNCLIAAGSGDNPQTKVLVDGDLLSLGTSFVFMVAPSVDQQGRVALDRAGYANAMYDGLGRPFLFGCRTNGALVWDRVRMLHGLGRDEYKRADQSLLSGPVGENLFIWQPDAESFPVSGRIDPVRGEGQKKDLTSDYTAVIDTTLVLIEHFSRGFARSSDEPLHITGGPADSMGVVRRIAAVWNRPVRTIGKLGAGLGAAVAGVSALNKVAAVKNGAALPGERDRSFDIPALVEQILPRGEITSPDPGKVKAIHGEGGFAQKAVGRYQELIASGRS